MARTGRCARNRVDKQGQVASHKSCHKSSRLAQTSQNHNMHLQYNHNPYFLPSFFLRFSIACRFDSSFSACNPKRQLPTPKERPDARLTS
jgi:hypothetical protein